MASKQIDRNFAGAVPPLLIARYAEPVARKDAAQLVRGRKELQFAEAQVPQSNQQGNFRVARKGIYHGGVGNENDSIGQWKTNGIEGQFV